MRTFEQLNKEERRLAFIKAVKQIVSDLAIGRVDFEENTESGKEANKILVDLKSEYAKGSITFPKLKLRIAIALKRYIHPWAIVAAQETRYYENRELKELG